MADVLKLSLLGKQMRKQHVLNVNVTKPNEGRCVEKSLRDLGTDI